MTEETVLAATLLELERRIKQADDTEALARLRRLVMGDEIDPLDVRDTYADPDRVRRAVGIAIATCRLAASGPDLADARREQVVNVAEAQLRREVRRLLDRVTG